MQISGWMYPPFLAKFSATRARTTVARRLGEEFAPNRAFRFDGEDGDGLHARRPFRMQLATELHDRTDVVAVSPVSSDDGVEDVQQRRRSFVAQLLACGVHVESVLSRDCDEVLLCLSAPEHLLERRAEQTEMEKRLHGGGYADFRTARKPDFLPASYATEGSNPGLADPRQVCSSHVCASPWTGRTPSSPRSSGSACCSL